MTMDVGRPETEQAPPIPHVSMIMDAVLTSRHVITGEVRMPGAPRRLVDLLNGIEGNYLQVHNGKLEVMPPAQGEPRPFGLAQVHLDEILFAMPRGGSVQQSDTFETVVKVAIDARFVLPDFEISGKAWVLADGQRPAGPILGARRFAPITDAIIISTQDPDRVWHEEILVVNLGPAVLCLPPGTDV
jgi:hypothetical protein